MCVPLCACMRVWQPVCLPRTACAVDAAAAHGPLLNRHQPGPNRRPSRSEHPPLVKALPCTQSTTATANPAHLHPHTHTHMHCPLPPIISTMCHLVNTALTCTPLLAACRRPVPLGRPVFCRATHASTRTPDFLAPCLPPLSESLSDICSLPMFNKRPYVHHGKTQHTLSFMPL